MRNRRARRTGRSPSRAHRLHDGPLAAPPRPGRHHARRHIGRARGAGHEHASDRRPGRRAGTVPRPPDRAAARLLRRAPQLPSAGRRRGIPLAAQETDAHLVLKAWAKLGPSCLQGLDGMFALAVYDPRVGRLFLVRGGLGEQPLYWRLDGGRLAFASEVTTLTGYGPAPLVLRPEMLAIESPVGSDTPFQGIQLLAPATVLSFDVANGLARPARLLAAGGPAAVHRLLQRGPGEVLRRPGRAGAAVGTGLRLRAVTVRRARLLRARLPDATAGLRHGPLPRP
ncbi:hypothetical protein [Streptomyces sp. NBC_00063]|uniref:hypothetical protein n=1 Tax=Streptomyces sp. NBC_00063 TaxID=2975638 RepID=UPI003EC00E24